MGMSWGGVIWTDHALQRMKERGVKQEWALACFNNPDSKRFATAERAWVYYKTWGNEKVEVVAKQNERGEWVILSVWSRPVYGAEREKAGFKKAPWWLKLLRKMFGVR